MKDNHDDGGIFQPPLVSRATRTIAKRSRHSSRGSIVADLPAHPCLRIIQYESKLEQRVLHLYLARPDIWDIWEQPPAFLFRSYSGKMRQHFFDFRVTLAGGQRLALAVKPMKRVKRTGLIPDLRTIRAQMTKEYADEVVLVTDKDFTKAEALNAERYLAFKEIELEPNPLLIRNAADEVGLPCTVRDVVDILGGGPIAYRSVFISIYRGTLAADKSKLIDFETMVHAEAGA